MAINIHSDYILRNLRKPGEVIYRIPKGKTQIITSGLHHISLFQHTDTLCFLTCAGGLFEYVSGANYLGEIMEWFGYVLSTWSLPTLSFALFSLCFIGPRAYYHHRCQRKHK